jgi:hypothetical protein
VGGGEDRRRRDGEEVNDDPTGDRDREFVGEAIGER